MDELVDVGDISTASFQSPLPLQPTSKLGQLGFLGETALFDDITPEKDKDHKEDEEYGRKHLTSTLEVDPPTTPTMTPHFDSKDLNKKPDDQTPSSRQRRIRVNFEVERIMVSMKYIFQISTNNPLRRPKFGQLWETLSSLLVTLNQRLAHFQQTKSCWSQTSYFVLLNSDYVQVPIFSSLQCNLLGPNRLSHLVYRRHPLKAIHQHSSKY